MPEKTCLDHPTSRISSKQAHFPQFYTICFFTRGGFMHQHPLLFFRTKVCVLGRTYMYQKYPQCAKKKLIQVENKKIYLLIAER